MAKSISLGEAVKQAIARHQSGQIEEAVAAYKQILEQQPTCADALHYLGLAAHQQGNAQQAVDLLQRSVALQPDRAHYHNNFGKVLAALRRYPGAEAACRKALELEADYAEAWHNLALCCNAPSMMNGLNHVVLKCEVVPNRADPQKPGSRFGALRQHSSLPIPRAFSCGTGGSRRRRPSDQSSRCGLSVGAHLRPPLPARTALVR